MNGWESVSDSQWAQLVDGEWWQRASGGDGHHELWGSMSQALARGTTATQGLQETPEGLRRAIAQRGEGWNWLLR